MIVSNLGLQGPLVCGAQHTVVVDGLEHGDTVGRVGQQRTVVVDDRLEHVALAVGERHRPTRGTRHLRTIGHRGRKRAVGLTQRYLVAAVREGDRRLARHRVRLGDHAQRILHHDAAIRVLTGEEVAALGGGVGGRTRGRVETLHAAVGHVRLDRAVVERGHHLLVSVRCDVDRPTAVLGLHYRRTVGHERDERTVPGLGLLAAGAPPVAPLLRTVGVDHTHRTVAHLCDQRAVLLEERLVGRAVGVHTVERAVGKGDLHHAVGAAGHEPAALLVEHLLTGPARGLHVDLAAVLGPHHRGAVCRRGDQHPVVVHLGDRDRTGDARVHARAVGVLLQGRAVRVGLEEAAVFLDLALHHLAVSPERGEATVVADGLAHAVLPGHGLAALAHVEANRWLELLDGDVLREGRATTQALRAAEVTLRAAEVTLRAAEVLAAEVTLRAAEALAALGVEALRELTLGELATGELTRTAEAAEAGSEVGKSALSPGIIEELADVEAALLARVEEVPGALLHAAATRGCALGELALRAAEVTLRAEVATTEATHRAEGLLGLEEVALEATVLLELEDRALPTGVRAVGSEVAAEAATAGRVAAEAATAERVTEGISERVAAEAATAVGSEVAAEGGSEVAAEGGSEVAAAQHREEVVAHRSRVLTEALEPLEPVLTIGAT